MILTITVNTKKAIDIGKTVSKVKPSFQQLHKPNITLLIALVPNIIKSASFSPLANLILSIELNEKNNW